MSILEAIVLGVLQGITEFLPISSKTHLALVPWWLGWEQPPLVFDIVLHQGTALAILIYFWRDWLNFAKAGLQILRKRAITEPDERMLLFLVIATIPAAISGALMEPYFEEISNRPALVAVMLWATVFLLIFSERATKQTRDLSSMQAIDAFWIGIAQAFAVLPGFSRSGTTIAGGLFRDFTRAEAARFSFLMALPIVLGAGLKQLLNVVTGDVTIDPDMQTAMLIGFGASLISGYLAIEFLIQFVKRRSLYIFAAYCAIFSILTLIAVAVRG